MAGIEPLKTSIRIWWMQDGKRERETLSNTPPTPTNKANAQRIADMIDQQIIMGIFDRDKVFPDSPKRVEAYFEHYIQLYKDSESSNVAPTSWNTYVSKIDNHIVQYWAKTQVAKITPELFERWVNKTLRPKLAPKTIIDIIGLWRNIWTYWARHQRNPNDPTQYVKISSRDADDIDPFDREEIATIIATELDPTLHNLWTVMLWSGLSSHELLPLAVSDIDISNGHAYISRGFVKGQHRATKNRRRKRQIELLQIAIAALKHQIDIVSNNPKQTIQVLDRDHSTHHQHSLQWLWHNPRTNSHYTYPQLEKKWKRHLIKCDIRYRPLNNGRHTYASQVLSSGAVSAEWLANQLGHASTEMIHKHYAKFIPKDAKHIIISLDQALNNSE